MSYELHKAVTLLAKRIDDKVKHLEESLGAKAARDYNEYSGMCGEITGLLTAKSYMKDLTHDMEELDE
jgi:hypothetical protein